MPEFSIKPKKKKYPVVESFPSGTISASGYISGSINYFDNVIENLESIGLENPSLTELIFPTIEKYKETRLSIVENLETLVSSRKSELDEYEEAIQDYEKMINRQKITEDEIQDFFEKNFSIIIDQKIKKLIPKKSFGGEKFPDFIAVLTREDYLIIEIEKPTDRIYTTKGDPSEKFAHAEQQVRDYLKWANENKEFLRKRGLPNISAENTKGLLIIGMSKNLSPKEKEQLAMHNFSSRSTHEIKTFDEILVENQQLIENLRKQVRK